MLKQVHREQKLGMDGLPDQPEPRLLERAAALLEIAFQAGRDDVGPRRLPAPRPRDHVIHREALAATAAVLAGVPVPSQDVLLVERDALEERLPDGGG